MNFCFDNKIQLNSMPLKIITITINKVKLHVDYNVKQIYMTFYE